MLRYVCADGCVSVRSSLLFSIREENRITQLWEMYSSSYYYNYYYYYIPQPFGSQSFLNSRFSRCYPFDPMCYSVSGPKNSSFAEICVSVDELGVEFDKHPTSTSRRAVNRCPFHSQNLFVTTNTPHEVIITIVISHIIDPRMIRVH